MFTFGGGRIFWPKAPSVAIEDAAKVSVSVIVFKAWVVKAFRKGELPAEEGTEVSALPFMSVSAEIFENGEQLVGVVSKVFAPSGGK